MCFEAAGPERAFKGADQRKVADTSKEFLSRSPPSDGEVTVNSVESRSAIKFRAGGKEERGGGESGEGGGGVFFCRLVRWRDGGAAVGENQTEPN